MQSLECQILTDFEDRLRKESGRDYIKLTMYPEMTKSFSLTPSQSPDSPSFTRSGFKIKFIFRLKFLNYNLDLLPSSRQ